MSFLYLSLEPHEGEKIINYYIFVGLKTEPLRVHKRYLYFICKNLMN